jgi:hypothetical protein
MSLPAGQQRILDAMEDALRSSEPRLASMYAIFARLTSIDGRPHREQLPSSRGVRRTLSRLWHSLPVRSALLARRPRGRRPLTRVLILSQLVAVLAVLGLFIGLNAHVALGTCATRPDRHALAAHLPGAGCPVQAGQPDNLVLSQ